jgi:hypothetical protein
MQGTGPQDAAKSGSGPVFETNLVYNTVGLKRILCNSGAKVPLQLLAIEEKIEHNHDHACLYNKSVNNPICYIDPKQFAHLYIATKIINAFIEHYVVAFVEGTMAEKFDELADILYRTVTWLKISKKRPHFFIYYYGNRPAINLSLNEIRYKISSKLRRLLNCYNDKESFCHTSDMQRKATNFVIYQKDTYEFNFSCDP